jgi:MFS family permease
MGAVRDAMVQTRSSLGTVVRNRELRRLNLALAGSEVGNWAYGTAIAVWAYDQGGTTAVGIWMAVRLGLVAVMAPFAGLVADRYPRRLVMVTSDLGQLVLILAAAAAIQLDWPAASVYVLVSLALPFSTLFRPAQMAILPSLARTPDELTAANGLGSFIESMAVFIGPAVAGLLLAVADIASVLVLDAATFLYSASLLIGLHERRAALPTDEATAAATTPADADEPDEGGLLWQSMAGFRIIWGHRSLRLICLLFACQTLVAGAFTVFQIGLAIDLTGLGPAGVGYLSSTDGVAALLGGLFAIAFTSHRLASGTGVGILGWAIPPLLMAVWPNVGIAFAGMAVIGVSNSLADVSGLTIVQRLTPEDAVGRVFAALDSLVLTSTAVGTLVMPALVAVSSLRWAMVIVAVPVAVVTLLTFPTLRSLDGTLHASPETAVLQAVPLFQALGRPTLEHLARQLVRVDAAAGTAVITTGEVGDRFFIVESGELEAQVDGHSASTMGPGDCFGEIALLNDTPRTATVVAQTDSHLLAMERADFLAAVSGDLDLRSRAESLAARRLRTA